MGEEDAVTEPSVAVENGATLPEKTGKAGNGKKEDEKDGVKEMEEDINEGARVEAHRMDIDAEEVKESDEKKDEDGEEVKETKEEDEKEEKESKEEEDEKTEEQLKSEAVEEDLKPKQDEENGDETEKIAELKEENEKPQDVKKKKGSRKKRGKPEGAGEKVADKKKPVKEKEQKELKTPVASVIERPVRERKSVERLVAVIDKDSVREFYIEKGRGTALKDIPNVAYKLSKRKTDDTFKLLHTILFGRRGKALQVKNNISRFSGYVWHENEEKQKLKIKEKFDKCVKEKLLDFCDVLDIPITKTTAKKEDIVIKLIDFLVAPYATTTELLAEKDQSSKKRKRVSKGSSPVSGSTPSKRSTKSQKGIESTSKVEEEKITSETEDESEEDEQEEEKNVNGVPEISEDEMPEHAESEEKEDESESESDEDRGKNKHSSKKSSSKKESTEKAKTKKNTTPKKSSPPPKRTPSKSSSNRSKVEIDNDTTPKTFSRKKKTDIVVQEKSSTPKKSASKEKPVEKKDSADSGKKVSSVLRVPHSFLMQGKKIVKGKEKTKEDKLRPSDDELRNAICEILKEVDFNTATFTDILKQLAKRFDTDLTPRKSSIKLMIQEELTKLADEGDDEEDEGEADNEEKQPSGKRVKV
ncbi:hypothetical protein RJ639_007901 [Escallonia herrerae]|uniref:DEK-C domain-containing protein n=1 Tax=Escallonia herrerae TaxID=1293975 RepID=A0AA88VQG1_9ASTE|nr:hypothetical protein RJ639_007901 [Escallonia herrerae]